MTPTTASVAVAGTTQLTSVVAPIDATNQGVVYSTSDDLVATVDSSGLVAGVAEGTATITVTTNDGALTDTTEITVTP